MLDSSDHAQVPSAPEDGMQLLYAIADPAMMIDRSGRVLDANDAARRLCGLRRNIDYYHQWIWDDGTMPEPCPVAEVLDHGRTVRLASLVERRSGQHYDLELVFSRIPTASGESGRVLLCCRDMTDQMRVEKSLRESDQRYALVFEAANDGMWDYNLTTDRVYYSSRWLQMLQLSPDALTHTLDDWFDRVHPTDIHQLRTDFMVQLEGGCETFINEHRVCIGQDQYRWMRCRAASLTENGNVIRIAGSLTDIHDRKLIEQQLHHDAHHDTLTGLPNRSMMADHLARALNRVSRVPGYCFAVLFLDFDHFKRINDSFGHHIGDLFLQEISRRLADALRGNDVVAREAGESTVARLGGDEFTILLDGIRSSRDAVRVAERLQERLSKPYELDGQCVFSSASIGIVTSEMNYQSPEEMLRDADTAMYRAKSSGRACHVVFDQHMHEQVKETLTLENDLRLALSRDQLRLYYQPIVCLETGRLSGFEALLRWEHPARGLVMPDRIIPIAEESGLILPIGRWAIETACRQLCQWHGMYPSRGDLYVTVNLSKRQLLDPGLIDHLQWVLDQTGIKPETLKLEITESTVMDDPETMLAELTRICSLGIRLLMDDFGTGHSSLSKLHWFPVDGLKVDQEFVSHMQSSRPFAAILQTIVSLAGNIGLSVVVEGIETKSQLAQIMAMDCHYAQGYLFDRPLPCDQAGPPIETGYATGSR